MKNVYYFILLLFLGSFLHACKTKPSKSDMTKSQPENVENESREVNPKPLKSLPDNIVYPNEFLKSQQAWLAFKKTADNSYKYKVAEASWTGLTWETTITVEDGVVTERSFKYTSTKGLPEDIPADEQEWNETDEEIGIHKISAEPLTLDEVYAKAEKEWLLKRENSEVFFETNNDGIISTCGYVINNCADDCFRGITIKNIESL